MSATRRLVIVAGRASHASGMHEFRAGAHLLAYCLAAVPGLVVEVSEEGVLPELKAGNVAAVVVYADGGPAHPLHENSGWSRLDTLARQGVGVGFMHYAVEAPIGQGSQELSRWIGGFYEDGYSCNPIFDARLSPASGHDIGRGVEPFAATDEWYFSIRRPAPVTDAVRPVLVTIPSDEVRAGPYVWPAGPYAHVVAATGQEEAVLWTCDHADGGRGFGFTGGHFHDNWKDPNFRRIVLNALVWLTQLPVPDDGVSSSLEGYDADALLDTVAKVDAG